MDLGNRPSIYHSLERLNVNGHYEKSNVVWLLLSQQCLNKQKSINITYEGKTQNLSLWAKEIGISYTSLYTRLKKGVSFEDAINKEKYKNRKTAIVWEGKEWTLQELANHVGINYQTLCGRLYSYGMTLEEALTKPIKTSGNYSKK